LLVLKRVPYQEAVEGFPAAVERGKVVATLQLFNAERGHLNMAALEYAWLLEKPGEPRRRPGPGRQRRLEGLPLLGTQPEALAVGQGFLGAGEGTLQNEFADGAARGDRGGLECPLSRRRQPKIELLITGFGVRHGDIPFTGPV